MRTKKEAHVVRLRGHHLIKLCEFLLKGKTVILEGSVLNIEDIQYGKGFHEKVMKIFASTTQKSNVFIEVTDYFDDICGTCSRKRDPSCFNRRYDVRIAKFYKLEINKRYPAKQVIDELKKRGLYPVIIYTPAGD